MTEPTETASETAPDAPTGRDSLGRDPARWLAPARLAIGLLQGLGLYLLYHAANPSPALYRGSELPVTWPATNPLVFGPLMLVMLLVPIMLLAGVGRLRLTTLAIWTAVVSVVLVLLGLHDVARQSADTLRDTPYITALVVVFSAAALFIAHHLVAPADMERRRIASYPAYFDTASKAAVQLVLSIGFTGAFWILLHLGAALFRIIGLDFLDVALREEWFAIPVTCVVFATAVHLTDVRDGLIRGVRTVGLMLLSWLLLVITVLVAGFLAALPFTGLDGLWETGSGATLVLAAAAALIVLINAAYQDGRPDNRPPLALRAAVRVAAVLITPLIVIAAWGLTLRIQQYGLTPDRIIALACALVGAAFAAGYGWAALSPFWRKGDWMRGLERTTIGTAFLTVAVILALFSPLLDPARLSVADQVARLERGAVTPDRFDYNFLRFGSGKAGRAALERLMRSANPAIARRARTVEAADRVDHDRHIPVRPLPTAADVRIRAYPAGTTLPASFTSQYGRLASNLGHCDDDHACTATLIDLDGDGANEVLVAGEITASVFKLERDGRWFEWALYQPPSCAKDPLDLARAFGAGQFRTTPPMFPDLIVGGVRLRHQEGETECPVWPEPAP